MELPDLPSSQTNRAFRLSDDITFDKGLVYDPEGPFNLKLDHKKLQFRLDKSQKIQLMIDFLLNGDLRAKTEIPMMGGSLNAQASRTEGQVKYGGNLSVPAFGGHLDIGASNDNGNTRANLQFRKEF